jgi:hypothetical protein
MSVLRDSERRNHSVNALRLSPNDVTLADVRLPPIAGSATSNVVRHCLDVLRA